MCVCVLRATWIRKHIKMGPHRRQLSSILRIGNGIVPFAFASYLLLLCSTNARMSNTCDSPHTHTQTATTKYIKTHSLRPLRPDKIDEIEFFRLVHVSPILRIFRIRRIWNAIGFAAENRILVFCRCRHINKLRARVQFPNVYGFMHTVRHISRYDCMDGMNKYMSGVVFVFNISFSFSFSEFSVTTRWRTTYVLIRDCFHSSRENNIICAHIDDDNMCV